MTSQWCYSTWSVSAKSKYILLVLTKNFLCSNFESQRVHSNMKTFPWIFFRWSLRSILLAYFLSHMSHENFLMPSWTTWESELKRRFNMKSELQKKWIAQNARILLRTFLMPILNEFWSDIQMLLPFEYRTSKSFSWFQYWLNYWHTSCK